MRVGRTTRRSLRCGRRDVGGAMRTPSRIADKRFEEGRGGVREHRPGVGRHEAGARVEQFCRDGGASSAPVC